MIASIIFVILLSYAVIIGALAAVQRRLIFQPDRRDPYLWLSKLAGLPFDLVTRDGMVLHSWLAEAKAGGPVVLYLHGNAGHIGYRADRAAQFGRLGWGVLLLGYRGYGGNAGHPSERGMLEDAKAGFRHLLARGIAPGRIVLWGESLGSGLAVKIAGQVAVGGLVLEAPYTSLARLIRLKLPFVPAEILLRDRFDCLSGIAAVHSPLFVLAGEEDRLIPPEMSREVFAAAPGPKRMLIVPRGTHNDLGTPAAIAEMADFIAIHLAPQK